MLFILDIDGTLINIDMYGNIIFRPFMKEFILFLSKIGRISVFSAADISHIINVVSHFPVQPDFIFHRGHIIMKSGKPFKDLSLVWNSYKKIGKEFGPENTIMFDDNPNIVLQTNNVIQVKGLWDNSDIELPKFINHIIKNRDKNILEIIKLWNIS